MYSMRPYQREALDSVMLKLREHQSTLVEMATGTGKTVLFASLASQWPGRVLVIAHRQELVEQAAEKIGALTDGSVGIEMGEHKVGESDCKVVVGSVQTLCRESRRQHFDADEFSLIITDEAHHAVGNSYRAVYEAFPGAKHLGVTATPKRADELALGQVFESVAYQYGIEPAVRDGWLVPVRQKVIQVDGLDFSRVRTLAGDFNESDLEKILTEEEPLHEVAASVSEIIGDRQALVFCVTVKHAEMLAAVLNRYRPRSTAFLSGATDKETRAETVGQYKAGRIQVLCNCALFLEGFDAPSTSVVVMARPTKSLVLYTQVLGRGTRTLPGVIDPFAEGTADQRRLAIAESGKPDMLALDFVGNSGRHKIVTSYDVLGGKWGAPAREYAKKTAEEEGSAMPVDVALERAEAEMALEQFVMVERQRRARIKARAEWREREVSPFVGGDTDGPTDKQLGLLVKLGVSRERARSFGKRQASVVIDKLMRERGWR